MAFFDFWKKKTSLEELLQKASSDASVRPEFYARLLSDDLVAITDKANNPVSGIMKKGDSLNLLPLSDGSIPIFTSRNRIFDKGVIKERVNTLTMKGIDLFTNTSGTTFILNPFSDYGKTLLPTEIQRMLNGTINDPEANRQIKLTKDTPIQIGQPSKYPAMAVDALKAVLASKEEVKAAYVAWILIPDSGEPPHYIFGFETSGEFHRLTAELGPIIQPLISPEQFFDMCPVTDGDSLTAYFRGTAPFFKR